MTARHCVDILSRDQRFRHEPALSGEMRFGGDGYRIDIDWMPATETPILSRSDRLELTSRDRRMLAGQCRISQADTNTIRHAMTGE